MYKAIKYRWSELRGGKFVTTEWKQVSPANFKEWFKRKPKSIITVRVKIVIIENLDKLTTLETIIDEWTWFRFGDMPHVDDVFEEMAKKYPCWYIRTKTGIWANSDRATKQANREIFLEELKKKEKKGNQPTDAATK